MYRDISAIYDYYEANKRKFSDNFRALIRMSLRLICETASKDKGFSRIDDYISANFVTAKGMLNKDEKTTLSNQSITDTKMPQPLHTGAHIYMASKSEEQTRALALIIGAMLIQSHGKK